MSFLRFLMLLALIVWVGGIIFFAFVEAPTLFIVLPAIRMAGDVVSASLTKLHWMGLISGLVFLACSLAYNQLRRARMKPLAAGHILIVTMLVLTAVSQFSITPKMRDLRAQLQAVDNLPWNDSGRLEFDRLHAWSTRLEGGVLLVGLGVAALTARRFGSN
jgi:Domain of unknown function (DUF4149)